MTQSGIHVVQELYRVALAGQEETIAQLVIPDMVWEILESFPHGGIYTGLGYQPFSASSCPSSRLIAMTGTRNRTS